MTSRPRARAGSTSWISTRPGPGRPSNLGAIEAICAAVELPGAVAAGACGRSRRRGALLGAGVARVVVGTAAVETPRARRRAVLVASRRRRGRARRPRPRRGGARLGRGERRRPRRPGAAVRRCRGRARSSSPRSAATAPSKAPTWTSCGPSWTRPPIPLIASGGVGTLEDLDTLRTLAGDGRSAPGRGDRRPGALRAPVHVAVRVSRVCEGTGVDARMRYG